MELSPNDQVLRALFRINEECKAILRAMDEIEAQNYNDHEPHGYCVKHDIELFSGGCPLCKGEEVCSKCFRIECQCVRLNDEKWGRRGK